MPIIGFLQVSPAGRVLENLHFHTGWWAPHWAPPDELAAVQALDDKTKKNKKNLDTSRLGPDHNLLVVKLGNITG